MVTRRSLLASLLLSAACSAAYADQPVGPALPPAHVALAIAPARLRAPYDVQILRGDGEALPTFAQRDRFYVQGNAGERYLIRITNPTPHRIEAVVSVDGLDAIDGENGDLRKRGYVVPAYGETRIEGFRTSQADVATFRFSSVSGSYAGQKGKPRNVGVIAVALFEEQPVPQEQEQEQEIDQQIIVGQAPPPPRQPRPYDFRDDLDASRSAPPRPANAAPASRPSRTRSAAADEAPRKAWKNQAPAAESAPGAAAGGYAPPSDTSDDDERMAEPQRRERLGLGTEFGEQRYSAANYTRFVRAGGRPAAIAELRYNDAAGLIALGIPVQPLPDGDELMVRETANPFPGDRFAQPPR
jgi:hypothetical protein